MDYIPHVCVILINHTSASVVNGITITKATGYTVYIIPLLHFRFWKPVYYKVDDSNFPSYSTENMVVGLVSQNMFSIIWTSRSLWMTLIRSYSNIYFYIIINLYNNIFTCPSLWRSIPLNRIRTYKVKQSGSFFNNFS